MNYIKFHSVFLRYFQRYFMQKKRSFFNNAAPGNQKKKNIFRAGFIFEVCGSLSSDNF